MGEAQFAVTDRLEPKLVTVLRQGMSRARIAHDVAAGAPGGAVNPPDRRN